MTLCYLALICGVIVVLPIAVALLGVLVNIALEKVMG